MLIINFLVTGAFSPFARSGAMSHMLFREWFYFCPIMTPKKNWNYCFRSFQFFFFRAIFLQPSHLMYRPFPSDFHAGLQVHFHAGNRMGKMQLSRTKLLMGQAQLG